MMEEIDYKEQLLAINQECCEMQTFLETKVENGDIDAIVGRLSEINVYLARSTKLLSDIKYIQDTQQKLFIEANLGKLSSFPATTQKVMIQSATADVNYFVNWLDRLNRSFVHIGDNMRTQISFEKENLRLTKSGY